MVMPRRSGAILSRNVHSFQLEIFSPAWYRVRCHEGTCKWGQIQDQAMRCKVLKQCSKDREGNGSDLEVTFAALADYCPRGNRRI